MTVKEMTELLNKIPDKSLKVVFDCKHCGHPLELVEVDQCVVISAREEEEIT